MTLQYSDNMRSVTDNATRVINQTLDTHIKQIQQTCKESIEQYIKKEMTLYYGVIDDVGRPFSTLTMSCNNDLGGRSIPPYILTFTNTEVMYTGSFRGGHNMKYSMESNILYDIRMPCIRLALDYLSNVAILTNRDSFTPESLTSIYTGFCAFLKEVNENPLKYVNINSDLSKDLKEQLDDSIKEEARITKEHLIFLKKKKEISKLKIQVDKEKKELQDYRNIKQEIEKCNKLKKHLVAVKQDIKKQRQALDNDRKKFTEEQQAMTSMLSNDELFGKQDDECPE